MVFSTESVVPQMSVSLYTGPGGGSVKYQAKPATTTITAIMATIAVVEIPLAFLKKDIFFFPLSQDMLRNTHISFCSKEKIHVERKGKDSILSIGSDPY